MCFGDARQSEGHRLHPGSPIGRTSTPPWATGGRPTSSRICRTATRLTSRSQGAKRRPCGRSTLILGRIRRGGSFTNYWMRGLLSRCSNQWTTIRCLPIISLGWVCCKLLPVQNYAQPTKHYLLWEKVAPIPLFGLIFLGLGRPPVGEFVGFMIIFTCFPTHHNMGDRIHPC